MKKEAAIKHFALQRPDSRGVYGYQIIYLML